MTDSLLMPVVNERISEWASSIADSLNASQQLLSAQLHTTHVSVANLFDHAQCISGKRLRPTMLLLCARAIGEPNAESIRLAAVVELLHLATLVHDDVLDGAALRRNRPTVHSVWGEKSSILLGDMLFTKAYHLASAGQLTYPARMIARCATDICEGELRQQAAIGQWTMTQVEYLDILRQKTAELCATSCALGAWTLDASPAAIAALESFGRNLGVAFQIVDDWLDLWGTQRVGKSLGSDLGERKPTLPTIRLLAQSSSPERKSLIGLLDQADHHSLSVVRERLNDSDASEFTRRSAQAFVERAIEELNSIPSSEVRHALQQFAWQCIRRAQ